MNQDPETNPHAEPEKIYCVVCSDWIKKSELIFWNGDDQRHYLCPGCGFDLLPVKPSLDAEADQEREGEAHE